MSELMNVRLEAWPLAADEVSIWLLSGKGPWMSTPIPADTWVHAEVEALLAEHGAAGPVLTAPVDPLVLHSPGWRQHSYLHPATGKLTPGPSVLLTYFSVHDLPADELVLTEWRDAAPVTPMLAELMGPPTTHAADEAPEPRRIDVLYHALRHLRFLLAEDATVAEALAGHRHWHRHLAPLAPALAGMYATPHKRGVA